MHSKCFSIGWLVLLVVLLSACTPDKPEWPAITTEAKPWTRWWWHGSAVTREGITAEMEAYHKAGIGGLEITPIYGVHGREKDFVNYLSPEWMELFLYTLKEADRLGLGIDMATGTGWPFGGPWVTDADACKDINYKVFTLQGGSQLAEKVEFIQQPYLRAVGSQVYEVSETFSTDIKSTAVGTRKEPAMRIDPANIDIKTLKQPISANDNLQALALDQVKFEKSLPLFALIAYSSNGEVIDLTSNVDPNRHLNWTAPPGSWELYALFEGSHGKMVERAGPGGEGNVIDHFSATALANYLARFDSAFSGKDIRSLRSFFNDSYEVDDARGVASWTPTLLTEFKARKGYALTNVLPALFGRDEEDKNKRVLCDYREVVSELLTENFTMKWKSWAASHGALVRNQAHGSPANILDLYAVVDIPEIEGVEPLRIKMASSAAHVTGKKLVSSESATWLNEHFESNLADIKVAVDRFLVNGVNHTFYHGTSYSPPGEPWPGWLFYAAVHLNPRNSQWTDFGKLNEYVARCQSLLQNSTPDNDVLIYFPAYDRFSSPGKELLEHFDNPSKQFDSTAFLRGSQWMLEKGVAFDYISDKQIRATKFEGDRVVTEGGSRYRTVVVPQCESIPLTTFQHLLSLAKEGATIILLEGFPKNVPGYARFEEDQRSYRSLVNKLAAKEAGGGVKLFTQGDGELLVGNRLEDLLYVAQINRETMTDAGLSFIRKQYNGRTRYFITNNNDKVFEGWLPLVKTGAAAVIYDPMSGQTGRAPIKKENDKTSVPVRFGKRQSLFVELYEGTVDAPEFPMYKEKGEALRIDGRWDVQFVEGGPVLPARIQIDTLTSWTNFGVDYEVFSGSATYRTEFRKPSGTAAAWRLDLGTVKESARVVLNGKELGTLIGPTFEVIVPSEELRDENTLEVAVSNLMANRIADLDKRKVFWKKFYNVNFPARKPENRKNGLFDASEWAPRESGLIGPVTLKALGKE